MSTWIATGTVFILIRDICALDAGGIFETLRSDWKPYCRPAGAWGGAASEPVLSKRQLDIKLADFPGGIQIWGRRPDQDETYGDVVIDGIRLDAHMIRLLMTQNIMPSLKNRVRSLDCPKCGIVVYAIGAAAYSPSSKQKCSHCGHKFPTPGRIRKAVANPLVKVLTQLAKTAPRNPREHDLELLPETL